MGGRAGFDMNTSHILSQDLLPAITLVGYGAGEGGGRTRARGEVGLHLCSVAVTILLRVGSAPKLLGQKP